VDGVVEVLAVIPARGGSKGIPHKNIRTFAGFPLVSFSISAGLQAKMVTRVIVSTNDQEIAEISRFYGAETPFLRPDILAQDSTTDLPVFQHALNWLAEHEHYHPDIVVQLRPTSPVRPRDCVDKSIQSLLDHPEADSARGVVVAGQNPYKMWQVEAETGTMHPVLTVAGIGEAFNAPRQTLPPVFWQTGHIDAIRPSTILAGSMSGRVILPIIIDPIFTIDLDTLSDWEHGEWHVMQGGLDMVWPASHRRTMPKKVDLLVLDFDGVLTDNRVWVDQDGHELVAANRSDSYGVNLLRQAGVETIVISKETNPVVSARCRKMNITCIQGEDDKATALKKILHERNIDPKCVVYCGNDINDLPCFSLVGWSVAVADSIPEVARQADFVVSRDGGRGAVRELCDLILRASNANSKGSH
jgi:YrbI family 3-deoxy-D-manno-octulosonate 8-phosphate phosphatase